LSANLEANLFTWFTWHSHGHFILWL